MTWLLLTILSGLILTWTPQQYIIDTWYIQDTVAIEWYFDWVDSYDKIKYWLWRSLWQKCVWSNCRRTDMSDCWGMVIWYMIKLWLLRDRFKDSSWKRWTYDKWWLNSYRLYRLWEKKNRNDLVRWDFMFMTFSWWVRHFAVYCWDWKMFDLYRDSKAKCRRFPKTTTIKYSSNWLKKYLDDRWIILKETNTFIKEIQKLNEEKRVNYVIGLIDSFINSSSIWFLFRA